MQICLVPDGLPNGEVEKKLKGNGEEGQVKTNEAFSLTRRYDFQSFAIG